MWNSWKRKARLASLFETSGCIFCGCIFLDASQPNRQKLLTWNASNFTNTKYHFLKYTLDRSQAPQQVHLRQVPEAAQLKCTEQKRPPWAGLQPLVSEVHAWALCTVHGAVQSAQCTAVDPREWSGWWRCGAETIHQLLQGIFFRGVFLPHQHVQVSCAGQRTKLYLDVKSFRIVWRFNARPLKLLLLLSSDDPVTF